MKKHGKKHRREAGGKGVGKEAEIGQGGTGEGTEGLEMVKAIRKEKNIKAVLVAVTRGIVPLEMNHGVTIPTSRTASPGK